MWPFGGNPGFGVFGAGGIRVPGGPCERLISYPGYFWRGQVRVGSGWQAGAGWLKARAIFVRVHALQLGLATLASLYTLTSLLLQLRLPP